MRSIRIDDEVWDLLQKHAKPFVDTPNDVLRRLLGPDKKRNRRDSGQTIRRRRSRVPGRTPERAYRRSILKVLGELGGRGQAGDVVDRVGQKMRSILKPVDYETISSGVVRWRNAAMWERKKMITDALLRSDSPHGYWELTDEGRKYGAAGGQLPEDS